MKTVRAAAENNSKQNCNANKPCKHTRNTSSDWTWLDSAKHHKKIDGVDKNANAHKLKIVPPFPSYETSHLWHQSSSPSCKSSPSWHWAWLWTRRAHWWKSWLFGERLWQTSSWASSSSNPKSWTYNYFQVSCDDRLSRPGSSIRLSVQWQWTLLRQQQGHQRKPSLPSFNACIAGACLKSEVKERNNAWAETCGTNVEEDQLDYTHPSHILRSYQSWLLHFWSDSDSLKRAGPPFACQNTSGANHIHRAVSRCKSQWPPSVAIISFTEHNIGHRFPENGNEPRSTVIRHGSMH